MAKLFNDRAILNARGAASMMRSELDSLCEKASGAFWITDLRIDRATALIDDMESHYEAAQEEMKRLRAAMDRIRVPAEQDALDRAEREMVEGG